MGPAVNTQLTPADVAQQSLPALQDMPLFAPLPESCSTELIVAPKMALTRASDSSSAGVADTEIGSVLSPSQVRCFFDCPARWWFKYGLQLPERKNSSLALGLAV